MQNALKRSKMGLEVWLVVYTKWNLDSHQRVALIGSRPYGLWMSHDKHFSKTENWVNQ